MLSFVAILATSPPMICSKFCYFNLGSLWPECYYFELNCSNKYCFLCRIFGTIQASPFNGH
ncbi:hypothetical protein FA868_20015 [Escherichia coli]|nr:hypothetical protein [Escherichia coli]EFC1528747.1 hypothetical protein [Escherichia coli]EFC9528204.1 hypothetical protein [Escherichia coli]